MLLAPHTLATLTLFDAHDMTPNYRLCALHHDLARAWEDAFSEINDVDIIRGDILRQSADAIVSPANSFGFMDGSLDLLLSQHFGWDVEARVREAILQHHDGELPVGCALIVPTEHPDVPWLISAPTMRVPMRVDRTANAYLAFRAVLRCVRDSSHTISSVLVPGLGTGCGMMPASRCAIQMRAAWDAIIRGELLRKGGLAAAARHHIALLEED